MKRCRGLMKTEKVSAEGKKYLSACRESLEKPGYKNQCVIYADR